MIGRLLACTVVLGVGPSWVAAAQTATDESFVATPVTAIGDFTSGIEGPACDAVGNVYAVNLERQGTIGMVRPDGTAEIVLQLPGDSIGNGIRLGTGGVMFVADYVGHNIFAIDLASRALTLLAHGAEMHQPNDLAMGPDGVLYASDPNWGEGTGQLWRISREGVVTRLASEMGTTNGIEVSPDGTTLYVAESEQLTIWAFHIADDGTLEDKRVFFTFSDHGLDGMRSDVNGNLYVTRYGKGTVVKISPEAEILAEVDVLGDRPSNICLGGTDGRTAYVTEVEHRRLVQFRIDQPGLAWQRLQP